MQSLLPGRTVDRAGLLLYNMDIVTSWMSNHGMNKYNLVRLYAGTGVEKTHIHLFGNIRVYVAVLRHCFVG